MSIFKSYKKITIGIVGSYTQDSLPPVIIEKISRGLTYVETNGSINPDLASHWEIEDGGKTYIFHLKRDEYFNNGKRVTSDLLTYNYADVTVSRPDKQTIVFRLKDAYAPFLLTVSRPVFDKGYTGVGRYKISDIKLNGDFVQTLTLTSVLDPLDTIRYLFYPSEEALKMAFLLGEVNEADSISDQNYNSMSFSHFPNITVGRKVNSDKLVTLFYNTNDSALSDRRLRIGLSYALPDRYSSGDKAYLPYAADFLFYNKDLTTRTQDYDHAKLLIDAATGTESAALTIKTLSKYHQIAEAIAKSWKRIGINAKINDVDTVPSAFQIFLGDFNLSKDPDQYSLWHSDQVYNITHYKNLRIDKLLEDGRKTDDIAQRKIIYDEFQKYLLEDEPASFLYFPYEYTLVRK